MALKDLIKNENDLDETALENYIKGKVDLLNNEKCARLTMKGRREKSDNQILLYLAGVRAWGFIDIKSHQIPKMTQKVISSNLNMPIGTVKPQISKLVKDGKVIQSIEKGYQISISAVEDYE